MEFKNNAQERCYARVGQFMREIFGEQCRALPDGPVFFASSGSTLATVEVCAWKDDSAVVSVLSWVVTDVEPMPALMSYLLHKNDEVLFGAFGMDDANDIFFRQAILGTTLDKDELKSAVSAVLCTADQCDDEIVSKFGGKRAADR